MSVQILPVAHLSLLATALLRLRYRNLASPLVGLEPAQLLEAQAAVELLSAANHLSYAERYQEPGAPPDVAFVVQPWPSALLVADLIKLRQYCEAYRYQIEGSCETRDKAVEWVRQLEDRIHYAMRTAAQVEGWIYEAGDDWATCSLYTWEHRRELAKPRRAAGVAARRDA